MGMQDLIDMLQSLAILVLAGAYIWHLVHFHGRRRQDDD